MARDVQVLFEILSGAFLRAISSYVLSIDAANLGRRYEKEI
jgi:hypothetical protein